MQKEATVRSHKALFLNTAAFTLCFAAWMINGVLVTFLTANQVFDWGPIEIGWLMGIPILTGALLRLPAGILTDMYGGKPINALSVSASGVRRFCWHCGAALLLLHPDATTGTSACRY